MTAPVRRVAALYDVHGNLPALDAVLSDPRLADADLVVCGGDVVAGPLPRACLERLEALGSRVRFVRGNGDREVTATPAGGAFPDRSAWCAELLTADQRERVREWPLTEHVAVRGLGRVLFCHAVPSSDMPILTTLTPEAEMERELGPVDADVVVCGHVHVQYDRTLAGGLRVVNAGSVGAPYQGRAAAFWLLLGPGVEHVATDYDVGAAIETLERTGCPDLEWLVRHALREPIPADEAMAQFEERRSA
ncbi:MAG: metallophosphoesterase family protein [Actinobacteria bacterium]|nr:metallophosphoesterase family protein [Actinomycetota bacterium]